MISFCIYLVLVVLAFFYGVILGRHSSDAYFDGWSDGFDSARKQFRSRYHDAN